jgi:hypothetical protein
VRVRIVGLEDVEEAVDVDFRSCPFPVLLFHASFARFLSMAFCQ